MKIRKKLILVKSKFTDS